MKTSPVAVALALLAALVLGTAFASPALAHDRLKSSDPAKGAKVESLEEVKLTFSAGVRFPNVVVRSGDETHQDGKPAVDGPVVTQKVKGDLPPGEYVIAYRVVSSDGHPIEGEIPFTLLGSADSSPSPSSTSPEPAGSTAAGSDPAASTQVASTPVATLSPAAAAGESEEPGSSGGVPGWMWIVVGSLTGIGIGLFFSMRGRKQP
ncbi:copper resistance protein CopC [Streptosporangium sp. NBC_01495]|uniref:copper resistance CopC family protein n=1 Tax=Streptosporangium sp. NBC_01495 TaxID=2903899 RepID=UPI002E3344A0|nr:copper resistance CopC family protein [Streptosporangium sp. NBC_01495]